MSEMLFLLNKGEALMQKTDLILKWFKHIMSIVRLLVNKISCESLKLSNE
jgi:hypothetical protein